MRFRNAVQGDAKSLKALHMQSWRTAYAAFAPPDVFGDTLEADMARRWDVWPADRLIRVAEKDDGAIQAFASVAFTPAPYLDNLHVDPARKRQGLGHQIMSDLARVLLKSGHDSLALTVIEGNSAARSFYAMCHGSEQAAQPDRLLGHPITVRPVTWDKAALMTLSDRGSVAG